MDYKKTIKELLLYKMKIPFNLEPLTADTNTCEYTYTNSHHNSIQDYFENNEKYQSINSTRDSTLDIEKSYLLDLATLISNKEDKQGKICTDSYRCENEYIGLKKIENSDFIKNDSHFNLENSKNFKKDEIFEIFKIEQNFKNYELIENDENFKIFKIEQNFKTCQNFETYQNFKYDEIIENDENFKFDKKKGKSNPLPQQAEDIYSKLKLHYENKNEKVPHLFRKDGIRKKIKTHFFQWIKKLLDNKIKEATSEKKLKFKKLEQNTIANINLKFNSDLLQKTVIEVYDKDCEENNKLIETLLKNSNKEISEFLDTPLYLLYNDYFDGNQYKKDFKKIKKKINYLIEEEETEEDKEFILLYLKIYEIFSENFVNYYMKTMPNKRSFPTNRRPIKNSIEYENENNSKSVSESESKSEEN
jgi:hypothetical protein